MTSPPPNHTKGVCLSLTVAVVVLPASPHAPVGQHPQVEASVLAVQSGQGRALLGVRPRQDVAGQRGDVSLAHPEQRRRGAQQLRLEGGRRVSGQREKIHDLYYDHLHCGGKYRENGCLGELIREISVCICLCLCLYLSVSLSLSLYLSPF